MDHATIRDISHISRFVTLVRGWHHPYEGLGAYSA